MPLARQGHWKCQQRKKETEKRNFNYGILELQITLQIRALLHCFTGERSKEMAH